MAKFFYYNFSILLIDNVIAKLFDSGFIKRLILRLKCDVKKIVFGGRFLYKYIKSISVPVCCCDDRFFAIYA